MAGQKLTLTIEADGSRQTINDINQIRQAVEGFGEEAQEASRAGFSLREFFGKIASPVNEVTSLAFSYNEVTGAVQNLLGQLGPAYELLIGANERLNQQLLQSAASITATSQVMSGGMKITDPTQAITSLQPALKAAIRDVELATQSLVGITSQQTSTVFNTILSNVGLLNDQLKGAGKGGTDLNNAIEGAASLAPGLVATLGTLQLPLEQASDEIGNLLKGEIDSTAQVAKSLGITKEMIQSWKSQGILISELNKRFQPFLSANALASKSVAGLTSNIQDIIEVAGRTAGAPLLDMLVTQLDQVYKVISNNVDNINTISVSVVKQIASVLQSAITAINNIAIAASPALVAIGKALQDSFGAGATTAEETITNLGAGVVTLIKVATPFIQIAGAMVTTLAELASSPAGQTMIQVALGLAAVNMVAPKVVGLMTGYGKAVMALSGSMGNLLPIITQSNIAKQVMAAREAALALAVGNTTAGLKAQQVMMTAAAAGNTQMAMGAAQVAQAEAEKAKSMANSIKTGGALALALASVALAMQTYQESVAPLKEVEASLDAIRDKLTGLDALALETAKTPEEAAKAAEEIASRNAESAQSNLSFLQKGLDFIRNGINQIFELIRTAIPGAIKNVLGMIANIPGINAILGPGFELFVEQVVNGTGTLSTSAETVMGNITAASSVALGEVAENTADVKAKIQELGQGGGITELTAQGAEYQKSLKETNSMLTAINQAQSNPQYLTQLKAQAAALDERIAKGASPAVMERLQAERAELGRNIDAVNQFNGNPAYLQQLEGEKTQIEANIAANQANSTTMQKGYAAAIDVVKGNIGVLEDQLAKETDPASIQAIQQRITEQKAYQSELEKALGDTEIMSQAIEDQGTIYEALDKKANQTFESLKTASNKDTLNNAAKEAVDLTNQQVELGRLTAVEGQERLRKIAEDGRIDLETRRSAQEAIGKLEEQAGQERLQTYAQQRAQQEKAAADGLKTEADSQAAITKIQQQEAQQRLTNTQALIAAEEEAIKTGRGSPQRLAELKTQAAEEASALADARKAATEASLEAELQTYKDEQSEISKLQAEGAKTDAQAQAEISDSRAKEAQARLDDIRKRIKAAQDQGLDPQGLIDQEVELATAAAQARSDADKAAYDARLQELERAEARATDVRKQAETQRQIEIQQLINAGVMSGREAEQARLDAQKVTLDGEYQQAVDHLASLQALPTPRDPDEREAHEGRIRAAIAQTGQLQLQMLQLEYQQQELVRKAALARIEDQRQTLEDMRSASQDWLATENRELQQQINLFDQITNAQSLIESSLQRKSQILGAQQELQGALNNLAKTESDIRKGNLQEALQLTQQLNQLRQGDKPPDPADEERRKALQEDILRDRLQFLGISGSEESIARKLYDLEKQRAQEELDRLAQQQAFARANLELEILTQKAAAERALSEARVNELKAEQQLLTAQQAAIEAKIAIQDAELARAEAETIQDPEERERALQAADRQAAAAQRGLVAAQDQVELSERGVGLAEQATSQAETNVEVQDQLGNMRRQALAVNQEAEMMSAVDQANDEIFSARQTAAEAGASTSNARVRAPRRQEIALGLEREAEATDSLATASDSLGSAIDSAQDGSSNFANNLESAAASAERIAAALTSSFTTGTIPGRRTGGDIQPGGLYRVHKDELFVSNTGGYMLNRNDAMRVAQESLSAGVAVPRIGNLGGVAAGNDGRLFQAMNNLTQALTTSAQGGITIQNLQQSVTNQVPRSERAIAQMVEQANLDLLRELRNRFRGF